MKGVRESEGERAGSGIPKVVQTGRKREKFCNIALHFTKEIELKGGKPYGRGGGGSRSKRYGRQEF